MRLKYQMRGLGIGMIVTALLMGVAAERGIPLSDAEIKAKAVELGMVESDSRKLTDILNASPAPSAGQEGAGGEPGKQTPEAGAPAGQDPGDGTSAGEKDADGAAGGQDSEAGASTGQGDGGESGENPAGSRTVNAQPGNLGGSTGAEAPSGSQEPPEEGDMVTVVIEAGVGSYRICAMLAELGLVEDAREFDTYLCDNGYSRKIDYGTYEIPVGAGEEEIAKIITRNR